MKAEINSKIVGAAIIGFALVAGAYTVSNLQKPKSTQLVAASLTPQIQERMSITVSDNDLNGIEDWRDEFITTDAIIVDVATSTYTPPDTLTGKMSLQFMEGILGSRIYAPFGETDLEIIDNTVDYLFDETQQKLYTIDDIIIIPGGEEADVIRYTNSLITIIAENSDPTLRGELDILNEAVRNNNPKEIKELEAVANVYEQYRDNTLILPVPSIMAKEHLDLINTFEAIYYDIYAMSLFNSDPVVTLLRLKHYQNDAVSLHNSLQNIYTAVAPFSSGFSMDDPGLAINIFGPVAQN